MHGVGRRRFVILALLLGPALEAPARASRESDALRARAFELAYNLDHDEAVALFRRAVAVDPDDPATYRGVAAVTWLNIVFRRGSATVDDYLGRVTAPTVAFKQPPAELAATFHDNVNRALALAETRIIRNPKDADGHFHLGAAVGLRASYAATVEGRVLGAFRAARRAYDEHETVLALDPRRKDAALIVGTYRYVVSTLSLPIRWMAYVAGFGGGKERGLQMIEEAAAYASDAQTDARFALILLYNREQRYAEALGVLAELRRQYPRNRLLWLETGSTALRARRAAEAETFLSQGIASLERDRRPRMYGEESLWLYKRGAALVALRRAEAAERDLQAALRGEARDWVKGRAHAELGKLAALAGDRDGARSEFQAALRLGEADNDPIGVAEARRLLKDGYQ